MSKIACTTEAHLIAVHGRMGSGKSAYLVDEARRALGDGRSPADLVMVVATPMACADMRGRLERAGLGKVEVMTPIQWALRILGADGAVAWSGRRAHVLRGYEEAFWFEDMLVTGEKKRRLREMLKFLQRGWTELRYHEQDWLINAEERSMQDFARQRLAFLGAYHITEVSCTCVDWLMADEAVLAAQRRSQVLVDDFDCMSRASQVMLGMLAGERLVITFDDHAAAMGEEPYAYAAGASELVEGTDPGRVCMVQLTGTRLPSCSDAAVRALLAQECMSAQAPRPIAEPDLTHGQVRSHVSVELDRELPDAALYITGRLDAGERPQDVLVVAPTGAWGKRMASELASKGIAASFIGDRQPLGGDLRDESRCAAPIVATALRLVADPGDAAAWRCWCGFGDYLGASDAFHELIDASRRSGAGLVQMLDALVMPGATTSASCRRVAGRYAAGRAMIEGAKGLEGEGLLDYVTRSALGVVAATHADPDSDKVMEPGTVTGSHGASVTDGAIDSGSIEVPGALKAILTDVEGMGAAAMDARIQSALTCPSFDRDAVRITTYRNLLGLHARTLVLIGLVNGLMPARPYFELVEATIDEQRKMHGQLIRDLYHAAGIGAARIACFGFKSAELAQAETLKLRSERIRLVGGRRMCEFAPSVVVEYLTGRSLEQIHLY